MTKRLVAFGIDLVIAGLFFALLGVVMIFVIHHGDMLAIFDMFSINLTISMLAFYAYLTLCDGLTAKGTLGKRAMKLSLKHINGKRPKLSVVAIRTILKFFATWLFPLTLACLACSKEHKLFYDILLKTEVSDGKRMGG